jgi:hypothetical protein
MRALLGNQHPNVIHTVMNLGMIYYFIKDYARAIDLFEEAYSLGTVMWGSRDNRVIGAKEQLEKLRVLLNNSNDNGGKSQGGGSTGNVVEDDEFDWAAARFDFGVGDNNGA